MKRIESTRGKILSMVVRKPNAKFLLPSSFLHFASIMQTERARRHIHVRAQHTFLVNVIGESALSLYTSLCSDVVTWEVAIILVPNVLYS